MTFIDTKYFGVHSACSKEVFVCMFGIDINNYRSNSEIHILIAIGFLYISIRIPRRSRWVKSGILTDDGYWYMCPKCSSGIAMKTFKQYCPSCGARLRPPEGT